MERFSRFYYHEFMQFLKLFALFHVFEFFPTPGALGPPPRFDSKLLHSLMEW